MIFNDVINQQQFVLPYFQTSSFPKVNDFFWKYWLKSLSYAILHSFDDISNIENIGKTLNDTYLHCQLIRLQPSKWCHNFKMTNIFFCKIIPSESQKSTESCNFLGFVEKKLFKIEITRCLKCPRAWYRFENMKAA